MTPLLLFIFVIATNIVTIISVFFIVKSFGFMTEKFKVLRDNLESTGMILKGSSFFGHPDKDTPINSNFALFFFYGYVIWLVGGFIFIFSLILFDLGLTVGFIIVTLQSR